MTTKPSITLSQFIQFLFYNLWHNVLILVSQPEKSDSMNDFKN
jgi:hypothetical protein